MEPAESGSRFGPPVVDPGDLFLPRPVRLADPIRQVPPLVSTVSSDVVLSRSPTSE